MNHTGTGDLEWVKLALKHQKLRDFLMKIIDWENSMNELTNHNIELLGFGDKLHTTVIDNNLVVLDTRIFGCNLSARFQEETISEFHDVGFMDGGDFLPVVKVCILEGIFCNTFGTELGHNLNDLVRVRVRIRMWMIDNGKLKEWREKFDLEALDNAGNDLVLET